MRAQSLKDLFKINFSVSSFLNSLCSLWLIMFLFFVFLWWDCASSADNNIQGINKLKKENSLLESELKAAGKPVTYVVLDIEAKKIYLKIRGIILKEFNITDIEILGKRHFNGYYSLIKRKAIFPPKRIEIKPPQNKDKKKPPPTSQETDTFDIEDMPSDYTLIFNEGLSMSVSPQFQGGLFMSVLNRISNGLRHLWNSSQLLWNYFKKTPFVRIQILMNRDDARALYWSLPEKVDFIVMRHL